MATGAAGAPARPTATPAVACTDHWKTAASGAWSTASNWSTGVVPSSTDDACITKAGTYTVTLNGEAAANTLSLGGASGTQTLDVQGDPAGVAILTLSSDGSTINENGVFILDAEDVADAGYAEVTGGNDPDVTLTNSGTFESLDAVTSSSADYIGVDLVNDSGATVRLAGENTDETAYATVTNKGNFTVTSTGELTQSNQGVGTVFTQSGGTLVNNGTIVIGAATFNQSGGSDSGNPIEVTDGSSLNDKAGAGGFTVTGTDDLSGTIPAGQTVTVVGAASDGVLNLVGNVTNRGTLIVNAQSTSSDAALDNNGTAGTTLTNDGTFETQGAAGDDVSIDVNLTNTAHGTVTIGATTTNEDPYANFTNTGTFTVSSGGGLYETGGSQGSTTFALEGGTLSNQGTMVLNSASFSASGGVESGNPVQLTDFSTLNDSGGHGSFSLMEVAGLSGTIPAGQTVTALGNAADGNADVELATDVINDGTFILDSTAAGDQASVNTENTGSDGDSTFTNNATFESTGSNGGSAVVNAPLTNDSGGTVSIDLNTTGEAYQTITNNGTFDIAQKVTFTTSGGSEAATNFTNNGTLDNRGTITLSGTNFSNDGLYEVLFGNPNGASALVGGGSGQTGVVALGGTLKITTAGSPPLGSTFAVVGDFTSVSGTFSSVESGSDTYSLSYLSTGVTATLVSS
jgi:hypothetical protein